MSAQVTFRGRLCFPSAASLETALAIFERRGSLIPELGCRRAHLAVIVELEMSATASSFEDTFGAMYEVARLRLARGDVEGRYDDDPVETVVFEREVPTPSAHRGCSTWWTTLRPPPAPPEFRARYADSVVHVLYALASEDEHDGPHCPSFVIGPLPSGILWDGGPWDAFGGPTVELERELNEVISAQQDPHLITVLGEALAWVQQRREVEILQVQEPAEYAGDGTSRPRVLGRLEPGFAD